ncbi:MAG: ATP-binding protein [Sandaracinaceae bacterium]|jgi:DNA replication protein DnaC|nr:ATP-binding protein [Sandaracinaceae bacterium]MBK8409719.1 ATP-binding protein [Sandaracinaceae bacterium]
MMTEPTIEKLRALKLYAMTTAWILQRTDPSMGELPFDERLALLVEAEALSRENTRLAKLMREAKLRIPNACMEDVDYAPRRQLDKAQLRQLATGRWIADRQNVLITGMTGVGKSYLGCALGQLACRLGFRVLYRRVPRLFEELAIAHVDGSYVRLLARLAKTDVLILDDWGLAPMTDQQRRDILEILEDRHGSRSTIVTSQLPVENWHDYIAHPTIADAVLDRLVHNAHKVSMKGPSRRKENAQAHS